MPALDLDAEFDAMIILAEMVDDAPAMLARARLFRLPVVASA